MRGGFAIRLRIKTSLAVTCLLLLFGGSFAPFCGEPRSKAAAEVCAARIKKIREFVPGKKKGQTQKLTFTEDEINSWLALSFIPDAHPCLRNLSITLEAENRLRATAAIDFNRLRADSSKLLPKLIGLIFSGNHTITFQGKIISSRGGDGRFELEKSRFDDIAIPNYLMNEIISAVCVRQRPSIDPVRLFRLPFNIYRLEVRRARLVTYQ